MNPDELRAAILQHHANGEDDLAAQAAAALAAHPQSTWTRDAVPDPRVGAYIDGNKNMPMPTTSSDAQPDLSQLRDIGDYTDKNKTQGVYKPAAAADLRGSITPQQQAYQTAAAAVKAPATTKRSEPTDNSAPAAGDTPSTTARIVDDSQLGGAPGHNFLTGGAMDYTEAALQPFARDVTLGVAPKIQNALAAAFYGPKGTFDSWDNFSKVYDEANDLNEQRYNQLAAAHPYANALGNIGGFIEGGRTLGDVVPEALAPVAGQGGRNALRAAAVGSATGATTSAVDSVGKEQSLGQRVGNALVSAGIGGVAGGTLGPALSYAAEKLSPAARAIGIKSGEIGTAMGDAWRKVSAKLNIDPNQTQAFLDQQRARGITPTIAGLQDARNAGQLAKLAAKNPGTAEALQTGQQAAQAQSPDEMAAAIEQHIPAPANPLLAGVASHEQAPATLQRALKTNMDQRMTAIRDQQVPLPQDLLESPEVGDATAGRQWRQLRERVGQVADPANATSGHLTVGEVDDLRQNLNKISPHPGSPHAQAANELMAETRNAVPDYNQLMTEYGQAAQYNQGFNHGHAGTAANAATNDATVRALGGPHGQAGHAAGIMVNLRDKAAAGVNSALGTANDIAATGATQRALQAAAPAGAQAIQDTAGAIAARQRAVNMGTPAVQVPEENSQLGAIVRGTAAGAVGMTHTAGHHYGRAVMEFLGRNTFAPEVQAQIGRGLMSPDRGVQRETLNSLRQAGVDAQTLRTLSQKIGAMAGYGTSQTFNQDSGE